MNAADKIAEPASKRPDRHRSEAIAGYLFIAVPMLLFLVLNIGAILLRALHQPLEVEHPERAR